ncbi:hypothetical protein [Microvirga terrestris]|uniref:Invasion associated locus B family protein n=1 Tax=Microvirga terrestris TaxID=2791024 RepID=A0ABS0HW90_9HYPH|nr:hypothetical protein [Microvirga terrestris]MBF9197432.1 hypothetical protein [Microvirga terrestris]
MTSASFQRGIAAGILSALVVIGTGPAALAQAQRSTPPSNRQTPAKPAAKPAATAKPPAAKTTPAKPAAAAAAAGAAAAATTAKPAKASSPGGSLVTSYGDWEVYMAQSGRSKICYALSRPKDWSPKTASRDPAYLFVSFRPAENVKNEVAFEFGFTAKENGPAEVSVGNTSYALLAKATNAWLKNPAEEGQAIAMMAKSGTMTVKSQSARGSSLTDRYSLNGFNKALEHARKECAS